MATFLCGGCSYERMTSDSHIGRSAKCPKCGQSSLVQAVVESPSAWNIEEEKETPSPPPLATSPIQVTPVKKMPRWARITLLITWLGLGGAMLIGISLFVFLLASAENVMQEAAIGAIFATFFIAGYIVARCLEKGIRAAVE